MPSDIDPIKQKVREICKRLKPIIGSKIDKFWRMYCFSDDRQRKDLETYIDMLAAKTIKEDLVKDNIVLIPPSEEDAYGSYCIGDVEYNNKLVYPFGLREKEWNQHAAILGRSGSGKTNTGFWVIHELFKHGKSFMVFDWKRNYRDLLSVKGFEELKIYTVGRSDIAPLRFNPLVPPPNVKPEIWLKLLIEVIGHAYFLGDGVAYIMQQAIDSVYRESGVYDGKTDVYPTFKDVLRWVKTYNPRGREINWLSSALRAVSSLCFGDMNELLNIDNNKGVVELLNDKVILELDALTVTDRIMVIESLLLWIYQYRLSSEVRERFDHAILIEEAHNILGDQKRNLSGGETIMETVFRQCRELNESLIILDQHPAQISHFALANTYTTIVMNLKHRKDVDMINKCLLLKDEEKDYPIMLSLGQAIIKLQDRIQGAFLVKIPEFYIKKGIITDDFIKKRVQKPGISYALSKEERLFLVDIRNFPDSSIVQRYERLSTGPREGTEIKEHLISKGYIAQEDLVTATGRLKRLRLTALGMGEFQADVENATG